VKHEAALEEKVAALAAEAKGKAELKATKDLELEEKTLQVTGLYEQVSAHM